MAAAHFVKTALFSWFYTTFKLARIIRRCPWITFGHVL
ncbi:hypothetical protein TPY_0558 [Sulfobacillus acidophilus TPY]|nr:hypothetical protein TPY_0558 [Sulfobacillus acidophilus TPY]